MIINKEREKGRSCGECTVCCTVMEVKEINKPFRTTCSHLCMTGCGIYETRPGECAIYECLWLQGWYGNEESRPDKLGILLNSVETGKGMVIVAWEVWEKAAEGRKASYLLEKLSKLQPLVLKTLGRGMQIIGRLGDLPAFLKRHGLDG